MDHRIYRTFFAPFVESRTTYHYNIPSHNLICLEKLNEISLNSYLESNWNEIPVEPLDSFPFLKSFPYDTDSCTVLYPGLCFNDRAYDFVFKQIFWKRKLASSVPKRLKTGLNSLKKKRLLKNEKLDKKTFVYLKLIKNAPTEEFVGDYNWLYTGGNLAGFKYYNDYCLITPDEHEESTFLNIINLDSTFSQIWSKNVRPKRFHLLENEPVYQITCKNNSDAIFFSVRQRERIILKKLSDDYKMFEIWNYTPQKTKSDKEYLTSCDLSQDSKYLCLINNNFQITIYNVELETTIFSDIELENENTWNRILFNNEGNEIYFADQGSFKIFDLRADFKPRLTYKPTAITNRCEKICNFFGSECRENIIYIITSHSMIELDIRNGKNIQRWTHMMKFPAQFGGTSRKEDKELIILQSEDLRELVGISNEGLHDNFAFSRSGPYLFSSLHQELIKAHVNGIGLHHKIEERLDFNITGLHVVGGSGGINVCTVNGGGDVFITKLKEGKKDYDERKKNYEISSDAALGFQNFERHCYQAQTKNNKFSPSKMYDVTSLLTALKNPHSKMFRRRKIRELSYYWPRSEIHSLENLNSCSDFISEKILPHWDIKIMDHEETVEKQKKKAANLEDRKAKVSEWFASNIDKMVID